VQTAQRHGIRVVAIDCLASYYLKGLPDPHDNLRQLVMNYYAQLVINSTTEHKWLALLGHTHTNAYNFIPGVAELTGGLGIRIKVDANLWGEIKLDPGAPPVSGLLR